MCRADRFLGGIAVAEAVASENSEGGGKCVARHDLSNTSNHIRDCDVSRHWS
jgi:hypothetical protein